MTTASRAENVPLAAHATCAAAGVRDVDVTTPSGDTVISAGQVAVPGTYTLTAMAFGTWGRASTAHSRDPTNLNLPGRHTPFSLGSLVARAKPSPLHNGCACVPGR